MNVEVIKSELCHEHIVAVNVHDGDDKAFGRKARVLVESFEEIMEGDVRDGGGIEDRLARASFLFDEVQEQFSCQEQ